MLLSQNPKQKGLQRDRRILLGLEGHQALTRSQIQALYFHSMAQGKRKAQERLQRLHLTGRVNRSKGADQDYIYYLGDRPGMLDHLVGVNWIRLWLRRQLHSWEVLQSWQYEQEYKVLRCDGFAAIKNTVTGKYKFLYIENDRGTNVWDKVQKYNRLFEKEGYSGSWWVKLTDRFPPVLVATTGAARVKRIRESIERDNTHGLEFRVYVLEDLKKEVLRSC